MAEKAEALATATALLSAFQAAGATRVEADILQPAETLLDLYGEDIRTRAYVTNDPVKGEAMLRPDFTVPVVQMHEAGGGGEARYTYSGEVFRMQEEGSDRPTEYVQVGFERFGGLPAQADAEVFGLFHSLLAPRHFVPVIGDIGLIRAAISGLTLSDRRKAALLRHLWRPTRFRSLLKRFGAPLEVPNASASPDSPEIGLRSRAEVDARRAALEEEAAQPPLSAEETAMLESILSLREAAGNALQHLADIAVDLTTLRPAVRTFEERLTALSAKGIQADRLPFEASYGRTSMEYYDGFVFGFTEPARPDLPPVATGGRYNALTRALGGHDATGAVGGVIRPGLLIELGGTWR
ncbi:MAG: ATP phosphoribosyltransferase regulatory subunit [Pseudomonadota bacterium]